MHLLEFKDVPETDDREGCPETDGRDGRLSRMSLRREAETDGPRDGCTRDSGVETDVPETEEGRGGGP